MNEMNKMIGEKIRSMRKASGMSQMKLADKIDVSYQQVQKYEKGTTNFTVTRLMQISNIFGVPFESFLHGEDLDTETLEQSTQSALTDEELGVLQLFRRLGRKNLRTAFYDILMSIVKIAEEK